MKLVNKLLAQVIVLYLIVASVGADIDRQKRPNQELKEKSYLESIKLLDLRLANVQEKWRKGEKVMIKVLTTNKGKTIVKIPVTVSWNKYEMSVLRENNQPVAMTPFLEKQLKYNASSFFAQEIKPGETVEEKVGISNLFDLTQKGAYKVVFKRQFFGEGRIQHELISNSITISIVE